MNGKIVAVIAGWVVTESGRQPWIATGILRTLDAASPVSAGAVLTTLILFVLVYLSVFSMGVFFGSGMALIVGGIVIGAVGSWRLTFLIVGLPGLAVALLAYTIKEPQRKNLLRTQGGETSYRSDFIAQYLIPVLYPGDLTRNLQLLLGTVVVVLNAAVYWWLWRMQADDVSRCR